MPSLFPEKRNPYIFDGSDPCLASFIVATSSRVRRAQRIVHNSSMSDALDLFDDSSENAPVSTSSIPELMTESQRQSIRRGFADLGIAGARDQFAVVEELTGQRINSVAQLESRYAQKLIYGLAEKARTSGMKNTGSAWDDRDEDTWIDKL
jgi:hypothetical protein